MTIIWSSINKLNKKMETLDIGIKKQMKAGQIKQ